MDDLICQKCKDKEVTKEFRELHKQIVNLVVDFCKKHNIEVDDFEVYTDGLLSSIDYGSWHPGTDSSFRLGIGKLDDPSYLWSC